MQLNHRSFLNTFGLFLFIAINSCNEHAKTAEVQPAEPVINTRMVTEDSIISQIRPVLVIHETNEIQMGGAVISSLDVDSIHYQKISMKNYYLMMKAELTGELHLSTNKEKTEKANKGLVTWLNGLSR